MSDSYGVGCNDCREYLTVGQAAGGSPFCFYSGEPDTMEHLKQFLYRHWRHALTFDLSEYFWDKDFSDASHPEGRDTP